LSKFQNVLQQAQQVRTSNEGVYEKRRELRIQSMKNAAVEWDKILDRRRVQPLEVKSTDGYISAEDVAKECGVTNRRITEICRRGEITAERISNRWYIPTPTAHRLIKAYEFKKASGNYRLFI